MSAIELYHQDGHSAGIFYCSQCRCVARTIEEAEACHGEHKCACGKDLTGQPYYKTQCDDCDNKAWRERQTREEFARFEKATKIKESEWTGDQVYTDDDRYFADVTEAIEHCEADGGETPEYIWVAKNQGVRLATIEDLAERLLEDMWEDAELGDLNGVDELQAAIDAFNKANRPVVCWMVDYSTAILIEPRTRRGE
jgi:hypothetical protein